MERVIWDVIEFCGQKAQISLGDSSSDCWGHINFADLKGDITCAWGKISLLYSAPCEIATPEQNMKLIKILL